MNNYICTAKGFVQGKRFDTKTLKTEVLYTDKVRYAQQFKTNGATKFMENHDIEGFVWKPQEQEAIRNMYVVRKRRRSYETLSNEVEEWIVEKAIMQNESDVKFLVHQKLQKQDMMTFDVAKARALELNLQMVNELNEKITSLTVKSEE